MEPCPEPDREDKAALRTLAKKWFEKGEQCSRERDDVNAIRAFQCSLSFIPHGFTAFNLAEVAERVGDLDLAISNFKTYLTLVPEAEDKADVERRIVVLQERLDKALAAMQLLTEKKDPPKVVEPEPPLKPDTAVYPLAIEKPVEAPIRHDPTPWYRSAITGYVAAGVGVAMIGTGIAFNVASRGKRDDSFAYWDAGKESESRSALSSAKRYAYGSYALFSAGAAALAAGIAVLALPGPPSQVEVSLSPEGGASLLVAGRF